MTIDFATAALDCDYLLASGLLFEVNRQFFHPFGLALAVRVEGGKKVLGLTGNRSEPDKVVFDKGLLAAGRGKFEHFLKTFGFPQMDRRTKKMGKSVQHVEAWVAPEKKDKRGDKK